MSLKKPTAVKKADCSPDRGIAIEPRFSMGIIVRYSAPEILNPDLTQSDAAFA
jgi:hypothetical protein